MTNLYSRLGASCAAGKPLGEIFDRRRSARKGRRCGRRIIYNMIPPPLAVIKTIVSPAGSSSMCPEHHTRFISPGLFPDLTTLPAVDLNNTMILFISEHIIYYYYNNNTVGSMYSLFFIHNRRGPSYGRFLTNESQFIGTDFNYYYKHSRAREFTTFKKKKIPQL